MAQAPHRFVAPAGHSLEPAQTCALPNCEAEGISLEPKASERLYHLRTKPAWAGGNAGSQ